MEALEQLGSNLQKMLDSIGADRNEPGVVRQPPCFLSGAFLFYFSLPAAPRRASGHGGFASLRRETKKKRERGRFSCAAVFGSALIR